MSHGLFENLHHLSSGAELSKTLADGTCHYYGTAAIEFLEKLTNNNWNDFLENLKAFRTQFLSVNLPKNASGQVHRVCERFALIAFAGELATRVGVTGWTQYNANDAAVTCFKAWLDFRGGICNQEKSVVLSQVRSFFETHGESRFTEWNSTEHSRTINRAGFKKIHPDGTQFYYVFPESFKHEICSGIDSRMAANILLAEKWLLPGEKNEAYRREYLPHMPRSRCYVFTSKIWED